MPRVRSIQATFCQGDIIHFHEQAPLDIHSGLAHFIVSQAERRIETHGGQGQAENWS